MRKTLTVAVIESGLCSSVKIPAARAVVDLHLIWKVNDSSDGSTWRARYIAPLDLKREKRGWHGCEHAEQCMVYGQPRYSQRSVCAAT